jgi:hypothetical protein
MNRNRTVETQCAKCPSNDEVLAALPAFRAAWRMRNKTSAQMQEIAGQLSPAQLQETLEAIADTADFFTDLVGILVHSGKALAEAEQRCGSTQH